jgi:hypothetical protein
MRLMWFDGIDRPYVAEVEVEVDVQVCGFGSCGELEVVGEGVVVIR